MHPFTVAESISALRDPYPSASRLLEAAAGGKHARLDLVQLWISEGIPFAFRDCPAVYASIRAWLGQRLDVHPKTISMTGSGRFGESWVPSKCGNPFTARSDLDLFLVSADFFGRVEKDFVRWKADFEDGIVEPQNDREAKFWNDHRVRGPRIIARGFLDYWMIPMLRQYKIRRLVGQTMWYLKHRLDATENAPSVREASLRVYRDMQSLTNQESLNLRDAAKLVSMADVNVTHAASQNVTHGRR